MSKTRSISVIIADTAFIIRKGLRTLILENEHFDYLAEVTDTKGLHDALKKQTPDVLIVDHCCDDCFSINVIAKVKRDYPQLNILVISHEKTANEIKKIIGIGIKNYLLKDCDEQEITDAIKSCAKGEKYFCGQIIDVLLEKEISIKEHCATGGITEREIQVIKELVAGKRPKEIAGVLNISYYTIITHKKTSIKNWVLITVWSWHSMHLKQD